jgi:hypothetical protein
MRQWMGTIVGCGLVVAGFLSASPAEAEVAFDLGIGYSHVTIGTSGPFNGADGIRFEPRVSFSPIADVPQFRLGFGLGVSGYTHDIDQDSTITINNGDEIIIIQADQWEALSLLEPELQLSWRQVFNKYTDGSEGLFVEPGVGIGAAIANFAIVDGFWWSDEQDSQWGTAFEVRPFLRAGYQARNWAAGLDCSYMFGQSVGLTDTVSGDINEFYIGAFFGGRW